MTVTPLEEIIAIRGDLTREPLIPLLQDIQEHRGLVSQAAVMSVAHALQSRSAAAPPASASAPSRR